jgi:diaminohydroxyphosphoribosylaminopyrimidine deaminase/5-amino-6-(5-phosphoribosylamino)uracil reductase
MVGAVVVRDGEIVGTGYHRKFGGDHAEVEALREAGHLARHATLYCTLEPCSHFGKTPPCVNRVIEAGIRRVVLGSVDPNPLVNGRGIKVLRESGIAVETGLLAEACRELNESFFKYITTRLPFVTLKIAQSVDGKIADQHGQSRWISNERARRLTHRWRWQTDAVLVGIGTVLADDPRLTVRYEKGPQPRRIVLDSHLRIPLTAKLLADAHAEHTVIFISSDCKEHDKTAEIEQLGVKVWRVPPTPPGHLNLGHVLERMGQEGIASVMVEGGRRIFTSFLEEKFADRLTCFFAPMILGEGVPAFKGLQISNMSEAVHLVKPRWKILGDNGLVSGWIRYPK